MESNKEFPAQVLTASLQYEKLEWSVIPYQPKTKTLRDKSKGTDLRGVIVNLLTKAWETAMEADLPRDVRVVIYP